MAVLGVDISTRKIEFVFVGDDEAVAWQDEREVKGKLAADRFTELVRYTSYVLNTWWGNETGAACRVVIEGIGFVFSRTGVIPIAGVLGMVNGLAVHFGYETEIVKGTDWKMALGLSGRASKDAIRVFAEGEGYVNESQDLIDAYCVGLYGVRQDNEDD